MGRIIPPHIEEDTKTACKNICKLCDRLVISALVSYVAPNLIISLPAGSYNNGEKYCIVVAQSIPATTVLDAPVVIQVGTGQQFYPLTTCDGTQITSRSIRTRTKYSARVRTNATSGNFVLLGKLCKCNMSDGRQSLNGTA